ncbi:hypothetical protein DFS34DRAFT_353351 [Phlyctochytrium arcticum]|nr:hypothetical protein DFS34DRAFT_353351 [Phlyctochytrium arcticum]
MPDNTGCDATRLLFDKPPPCSWLGITSEYKQQAVNLEILREYDSEVIKPNTMSLVSQLVNPITDLIDTQQALLGSIEGDLNNNYQTKISGTNKIPYSLVSGNPDLSIYLNRTTDLNTINASIGTKVAQSVYDIRQTAIDTSISMKQNTITSILSLSGVDSTLTSLLTDNFTSAPTGTLAGTAAYDATNKWVNLQVAGQTHSNDLYYGSGNDEGLEIKYLDNGENTDAGTLTSNVPVIFRGTSGGFSSNFNN